MFKNFSSFFAIKLSIRTLAKRPVSNAVKSLAISACLVLFTSAHDRQPQDQAGSDDATVESAINEASGLSRQRNDFDKAINRLADAAANDKRLAQYLSQVEQRIQGKPVPAASGSGIRVNKFRKKATPAAQSIDHRSTASATAGADSQQGGAWGKMKRLVNEMLVSTNQAGRVGNSDQSASKPSEDNQATSLSEAANRASSDLTVGDVSFEMNPAIEQWVNYYLQNKVGRRTMTIGLRRSDSYLEMARTEFRRLGVPQDLVWLAFVESAWHPGAMSPAAAGGIWQFIPKTATEYGLSVAADVDERFDPAKQTRVAATYLRDLHTIFGDWALAMAAYNCGEPRVMDAIIQNGRADFWEIAEKQLLPKETRNYVPKILAAIKIAGSAASYGFDLSEENGVMTAGR